jgi:hypothetical protein
VAGERQHRLEMLYHIFKNNLLNNHISCPAVCPAENISILDAVKPLSTKYPDIESVFSAQTLPINFEGETDHPMHSCWLSLFDQSAESLLYLVTETVATGRRHHLTEKALRPIACGQPFILAATAGSLAYLREYGFKTFHGHIDETYDTIQDPKDRLAAIVQEMKRISSLSESARQQLVNGVQAATEHNQKLFFSDQFHHQVISEFQQNLDQAVADVKNGPVGGCWTQVKSAAHEHDPETFLDFLEIDQHGVDWINTWIAENSKL